MDVDLNDLLVFSFTVLTIHIFQLLIAANLLSYSIHICSTKPVSAHARHPFLVMLPITNALSVALIITVQFVYQALDHLYRAA